MKYSVTLLLLVLSIFVFGDTKFEDLNKEHWAYNSINSLVEKGIIPENRYMFKGDEPVSRYEFANDLAKAVDYIDLKKANKEDLNILEALMLEFSQELNKIGFDASTFNGRLDSMNESVELLRERINENEKTIEDLKKRLEALENKN